MNASVCTRTSVQADAWVCKHVVSHLLHPAWLGHGNLNRGLEDRHTYTETLESGGMCPF